MLSTTPLRVSAISAALAGIPGFALLAFRAFEAFAHTERGYGWNLIYVLPALPFYITFVSVSMVTALWRLRRGARASLLFTAGVCATTALYWLVNLAGSLWCDRC